MTLRSRFVLSLAAALAVATTAAAPFAQAPAVTATSRTVLAVAGQTLGAWDGSLDAMLRDGTLDIARTQDDTMLAGRVHERLQQMHEGLPVFGGQLVRQLEGSRLVSAFGQLYDNVSLATLEPALPPADAAAVAAGEMATTAPPGALGDAPPVVAEPALGILPTGSGSALVYRMKVRSGWDIREYFVNAITGAIEDSRTLIRQQTTPDIGTGTGVLRDTKKMSADRASNLFRAIDGRRPSTAYTLDFRGNPDRFSSFLQTGTVFLSDVATSSTNVWTDGAIVDAHVYEGWVYDYFFKRFGRRGIDDRNMELIGLVHPLARADAGSYSPSTVGLWINNAVYLGDGFLVFGDGDGRLFDYLAGGFDVVAHEIAHGVTEFSSALVYRDESGALNEAFSDIMAIGAEYFHFRPGQGPQKGPNFLLGEDVTRVAPGFVRSAQNPIEGGEPDHYSLRQYIGTPTDNGGVHVNAPIVTHAFYLATAGGRNRVSGISVTGVGLANMERMERIFYRAFVFLMGSRATFSDARAATLQAATDLFGAASNERAQLVQAWTAVGVQ